ncbi:MAG TPA: flavodoxin family protein [Cyanobacteria bacterium UBA11149]|nr:flavodoxin family protein [Cyanobacteria bacterium UBA11367]HBE59603.1 flavodoxin family protein [Cyanobacteria bacterium UBA11366]HBK65143.1 flavodoxin family protein [Cyanobacteria bacterium UBA11166]HBR75442.1 flavodoxin family protein [Cyanobacteria bacterium UBA11159]HBS70016.1 flavodoxin family protein [Cyanobacteria bacterium UBA11153]HBW91993.1 flavodoxin family protein [Cyanobacteria bacterium UBA11149]HCA94125.1 flavodoxin family protein [Cyanobacteria bacterium UBA9226]
MSKLAIVYFSASNKTHLMAEAIAEGASQAGEVKVELLRILEDQIVNGVWQNAEILAKLNQANAIVFGSPTYMGGVAGQFKLFIDAASEVWFRQEWKDKIAAGFTHSSCLSGDKQSTLLYLAINAAQHGMIWVNVGDLPSHFMGKNDGVNRLGSFLGVMGQGSVTSGVDGKLELDPGDYLTAFRFGQRIAEVTQRWG